MTIILSMAFMAAFGETPGSGFRELLSGCVNGTKLASERRRCVYNLGRDGVCLHDVLERQESLVCFLCIGFLHC